MQKIGAMDAVNPYHPFLGMWITITRRARGHDAPIHPEEALTREQAIRFYTANNAYLLFKEKTLGSLEKGKLADFIVIDRDILTCPWTRSPGSTFCEHSWEAARYSPASDRPRYWHGHWRASRRRCWRNGRGPWCLCNPPWETHQKRGPASSMGAETRADASPGGHLAVDAWDFRNPSGGTGGLRGCSPRKAPSLPRLSP
jgi:hypothetical protein